MTAEREGEMVTMTEFVAQHGVTMKAEETDHNPHMDDSHSMDNWKCRLRVGRRAMTLVFSKGVGHHGAEPTVDEVLNCLGSDASSYENAGSFEDWASDYGYDTDSRKAERTYKAIERQARELRRLLGEQAYEILLWSVERQ